jgi:hypothetical protein
MKGLNLSKTGWLILSAGVFIVVLAGLGVTRSQQLKEQNLLSEELAISETRLNNLQVTGMVQQLEALNVQIEESEVLLTEAKDRMRQEIESIEVTDAFFNIADFNDVLIINFATTPIATSTLNGAVYSMISMNAYVEAEWPNLIDFIISLNAAYPTGVVKNATIVIPDSQNVESVSTASINIRVYSYEGS